MNNLSGQNNQGMLIIELPVGDCALLNVSISDINYDDDENYVLIAETIDENDENQSSVGTLILIAENSSIYGEIEYENFKMQIFDLGNHILFLELTDDATCGVISEFEELEHDVTESEIENISGEMCSNCVVDVMFVYDFHTKSQIESTYGITISAYIDALEQLFNATERRSSADHNFARIDIVAKEMVVVNNAVGDHEEFLYQMAVNNFAVRNLRNYYQADLVHILSWNQPWSQQAAGAAYTGYNYGEPTIAYYGYGYTDVKRGRSSTTTHEIGHNFGAQHHNVPTTVACKGKNFEIRSNFLSRKYPVGTVMTYASVRINYFSNPYVYYQGKPTGDLGSRFNHWYVNSNKCEVSNFKEPITQSSYIVGPSHGCPMQEVQLEVCYSYSQSPTNISWFLSSDGMNWNLSSTGSTLSVGMPAMVGTFVYVKAEITLANSQVVTRYHSIQVSGSINGLLCALKTESSKEDIQNVVLNTNPVSNGYMSLKFSDPYPQFECHVLVYNQHGILLKQWKSKLIGSSVIIYEISDLSSGNYIVEVKWSETLKRLKLVKL